MLAYGQWEGAWEVELAEIRDEIAADVLQFCQLTPKQRLALRDKLIRLRPAELAADINLAFGTAMTLSPLHPLKGKAPQTAASTQRPRKHQRERCTRPGGNDNASEDEDPAAILEPAADNGPRASDYNDADLLASARPLTDPEKAFMAGLAELALQATLGDFLRHAEENKSKEGGAS